MLYIVWVHQRLTVVSGAGKGYYEGGSKGELAGHE